MRRGGGPGRPAPRRRRLLAAPVPLLALAVLLAGGHGPARAAGPPLGGREGRWGAAFRDRGLAGEPVEQVRRHVGDQPATSARVSWASFLAPGTAGGPGPAVCAWEGAAAEGEAAAVAEAHTVRRVTGFLVADSWVYESQLEGLEPGAAYTYKVGCDLRRCDACAPRRSFQLSTLPAEGDGRRPVTLAVFGDMGVEKARSFPLLQRYAAEGRYDVALHSGDLAYNMWAEGGHKADAFLRMLEPVAANLPYHACPGNHEALNDFHHYRARFANLPRSGTGASAGPGGLWHSFSVGLVKVIMFSTEVSARGRRAGRSGGLTKAKRCGTRTPTASRRSRSSTRGSSASWRRRTGPRRRGS